MFAAIYSKVPVDDLIRGMIIQSANDACIVLAEGLEGATKLLSAPS
jgi:D-alanyl-D-alanine carboxypeptidase (penicillin-binding protein 5/6)